MSFLDPDVLPVGLRSVGRAMLPAPARAFMAATLYDLARLRHRRTAEYADNRRRLRQLQNTREGTCVIIGNGPSMRGFDLTRLGGVDTFCLNRGYLMWKDTGLSPTYLVAVNNLVLEQFGNEIAAVNALRFTPWEHRTTKTNELDHFFGMKWHHGFTGDVSRPLWAGYTVTFVAMQIAYHLGYRRVVLIGVDHRFTHEGKPNEKLLSTDTDPNHFTGSYFGPGTYWHAPDLAMSEVAYRLADDAFRKDGREIIDATEGGALRIFPRHNLSEALLLS